MGLPENAAAHTDIVPFNSLEQLEQVLQRGDVALVLTEPALTNCNVILPQPGFLEGVRELTRKYDALLCYDEAHTFQFAYGGLVNAWQLEPDFLVLGKGLGSGIGFGLYGMSSEVESVFSAHLDNDAGPAGIAAGGTVYGSALAVAAARAALTEVLTVEAYRRVTALGTQLADGLDRLFKAFNLPWTAFRLGPRSGYCLTDRLPTNLEEANISLDYEWIDARRVFMANRGIWDAVASAGPQASLAHTEGDVVEYLDRAAEFLGELLGDGTHAT